MRKIGLILVTVMAIVFTSCEKEKDYMFKDGSYQAEEAEFHYGWKGFLNAEIKEDKLVSVEFDYFNADGDLKSETTQEEYNMTPHPSVWVPQYVAALLASDITSFEPVDAISGATSGGSSVNALMEVALEAAKTGDTSKQIVTKK